MDEEEKERMELWMEEEMIRQIQEGGRNVRMRCTDDDRVERVLRECEEVDRWRKMQMKAVSNPNSDLECFSTHCDKTLRGKKTRYKKSGLRTGRFPINIGVKELNPQVTALIADSMLTPRSQSCVNPKFSSRSDPKLKSPQSQLVMKSYDPSYDLSQGSPPPNHSDLSDPSINSTPVINTELLPTSPSCKDDPQGRDDGVHDRQQSLAEGDRLDDEDQVSSGSKPADRTSISNPIKNDSESFPNLCDLSFVSEGELNVSSPEEDGLQFYYANCRGYSSKRESILQIVNDLDSDVVILTETNFKGTMHPELPNYSSFFRNRSLLCMGGVSIMVKNKFKNYTVRSKVGKGSNEFLIVKMSCFEPKLAIIAWYGSQKSEGAGVIESNIHELYYEIRECQTAGYSVTLVGDSNLQLGRELIENNDMMVSKAGNLFNEYAKEYGLVAANNLSPDPATYIRGELSRVLDVVMVDNLQKIKAFSTDSEDREFTPFTVKTRKGGETYRVYSDHRAIKWTLDAKMIKPESKLPPVWQYNKQLGDQKFDVLTDDGAEWLIDLCEDGDVDIDHLISKVDKFIEKSKFTAYGKRTFTRKKKERWDEKRMWAARFELVNKLAREFEKEKDSIRVWKARNIAIGRGDNQTTSTRDYRTGEMIDDIDEMTEMLLEYNRETMDKETPTPEAELLRGLKEDVIEELLGDVSVFPQSISWEVYMKVVDKIMRQKKGVLRDFIKSGPAFKCAVYIILNKIYSSEKIPEIFRRTLLTKLWKRKGAISDISNHRFIHGRHWLGKIFEKCLVEIISADQISATPDFQYGGIPGKSTREHLMAAMLMIKSFNSRGKSIPILMCDIRKCFDKLVLSDMVYDSAISGADLKAVKLLRDFHQNFVIMMAGDNRENPSSRVIPNTAGQGTNAAPGWAGNSQAQTIQKNVDVTLCAKVGDTQTGPKAFVDDVMVAPGGAKQARAMGPQITKAFDELSIKIHEDKTVVVVPGGTVAARKLREDLSTDPMVIQGHPIKIAEQDTYLGMVIHQGGVKESIEATFSQRKGKAWGKVPVIKSLLHHPQLLNEGWLGAAVAIIQGIIPPTMLYSCEVWMDLTKTFMDQMEKAYKDMIYSILEIPTHTSYAAVLGETGLLKIRHMLNRARLCYTSQIFWAEDNSEVSKLLREDWKARGEKSHVEAMRRLASDYGLPDLTESPLDHDILRQSVKNVNDDELMREIWASKSVEKRTWLRLRVKPHFKWPKFEARARILEAAGGFRFMAQASGWKSFYRARQLSVSCVSRMCDADDTADHAKICKFMFTKWLDKYDGNNKLKAEYYVRLSRERRKRFGLPIL